jgi:putative transposase
MVTINESVLGALVGELERLKPQKTETPIARKVGRPSVPLTAFIPELLEKLRTGTGWNQFTHGHVCKNWMDAQKKKGVIALFWSFIKKNYEELGWTEGEMKAASLWMCEFKFIKRHEASEADIDRINRFKSTSERKKEKQVNRKDRKKNDECQDKPTSEKPKRKFVWRDAYWTVPEALWAEVIVPLIAIFHPAKRTGRPRNDLRQLFNGIIWQLRTGAHFRAIPREYGNRWTIQRWRNQLNDSGCLDAILEALKTEGERLEIVDYSVVAIDGCLIKSRRGGEVTGPNPVDRKKGGVKRSMMVEGNGLPLSVVIASANTPDADMTEETIRRSLKPATGFNGTYFLIDRGYRGQDVRDVVEKNGFSYVPPERNNGDAYILAEAEATISLRKRRWLVERSHSWLNQYRGLLVRYGRKAKTYEAGLKVAMILTWFRRIEDKKA